MYHKEKWKRVFHKIAYVAGLAASVATIPQIIKVWVEKDSSGVSLMTWSSYIVISAILAMYGKIHKERVMVVMYVSLVIVQALIVVGVIIFLSLWI
jgi:uncharacterized protein with PQ loop repeat